MSAAFDIGAIQTLATMWSWGRVAVLTGAGVSTRSGIPDYRGEGTRARARKPIQHAEFIGSAAVRQRYWARSFRGWQTIGDAKPNQSHMVLADLEQRGAISGLITQNVDRLHHRAGSSNVVELHGALADVICLDCGERTDRAVLQNQLAEANPDIAAAHRRGDGGGAVRPDGDREIDSKVIEDFVVIDCESCGGPLKPDVVFFGGTVAKPVLAAAWDVLTNADALLVIGSSLTVYSGFRFVRRADKERKPVAIINRGETRGDPLATLKIDCEAGESLAALATILGHAPRGVK